MSGPSRRRGRLPPEGREHNGEAGPVGMAGRARALTLGHERVRSPFEPVALDSE